MKTSGGKTSGGTGGERAPSAAMLAYARRLAEQRGMACPPEVEARFEACRRFLDDHAARSEADRPARAEGRPASAKPQVVKPRRAGPAGKSKEPESGRAGPRGSGAKASGTRRAPRRAAGS